MVGVCYKKLSICLHCLNTYFAVFYLFVYLAVCVCLSICLSVSVCLSVCILTPLLLTSMSSCACLSDREWVSTVTWLPHEDSSFFRSFTCNQVTCGGPYFFPNKKELLFQNQFTQQTFLETYLFQPILFVFPLNNGGWFLLYQQFIYLFSPSIERRNSPISITCHNNDIMALIVRLN